mmetsp:Transcript_22425/g.33559  ORF Transcript_22425/g.33559 Transcript_22425/m.33559 type:complete len:230 (-) Transcript_22425:255-944(-)|eukprot:CAMPEP_0203663728 /NCGR_PEP_ID=MMETSP0090-20130426/1263_1 /ASSEMBLY_ACC=CAM_ASM_001088 /TAXON_ID=426623 /ORGANISM="Chaetoceros affinis, Strain CCMP159" /LENGTH=229 /DNA_ID=CAMNT_0050526725 /DNA_START=81 /DNA_END=770 /DNA_ORIENTATION=-
MYSSIALSALLISSVQSFAPALTNNNNLVRGAHDINTSSTTKLYGLTSDDILKRARKAAGVEEEPEPEPIFNETIMNDFQQSLLLLEKRVKEGPGSLSSTEVQNLDTMLNRILVDLRTNGNGGGSAVTSAAAPVSATPVASAPAPAVSQTPQKSIYYETNDEEGAAYNGKGGLGLAKGTTNTYVIEGMDEMSPEEYRKALQESVSGRQRQRRQGGIVGNLSSNNYLDNL